jgi:hypothetical protein
MSLYEATACNMEWMQAWTSRPPSALPPLLVVLPVITTAPSLAPCPYQYELGDPACIARFCIHRRCHIQIRCLPYFSPIYITITFSRKINFWPYKLSVRLSNHHFMWNNIATLCRNDCIYLDFSFSILHTILLLKFIYFRYQSVVSELEHNEYSGAV